MSMYIDNSMIEIVDHTVNKLSKYYQKIRKWLNQSHLKTLCN